MAISSWQFDGIERTPDISRMYSKNGDVFRKELSVCCSILNCLPFLDNHVTILKHFSTYNQIQLS